LRKGHDAISCDLLPSDSPDGEHYQGDVCHLLNDKWDLIIAHPPCTYLSNSGVRWLYNNGRMIPKRWDNLEDAMLFFRIFVNHPCKKKAIENPIPHKWAVNGWETIYGAVDGIGKYTQTIQPYEFGHTTSKRTCLWLTGLPPLVPTEIVPKEKRTQDIWLASPGPERWKLRSKTFLGIADAMANQWG
jgi:hypothetical protein